MPRLPNRERSWGGKASALENHVTIFDWKIEIHSLQSREVAQSSQFMVVFRAEFNCIFDLAAQIRKLPHADAHVHPGILAFARLRLRLEIAIAAMKDRQNIKGGNFQELVHVEVGTARSEHAGHTTHIYSLLVKFARAFNFCQAAPESIERAASGRPSAKMVRASCRHQGGRGVQQNYIASRRFLAAQNLANDGCIIRSIAAGDIFQGGALHTKFFGIDLIGANRSVPRFRHPRGPVIVISSRPSSPCTTRARRNPNMLSASASFSTISRA